MSVCLNMIVKNESQGIRECLNSVKPFIQYWIIVDTGSTDETMQIIRETMQGIPGELVQRPWVNFSYNRNEAIELARGKGDYLLLIDADERLLYEEGFKLPELKKDLYLATVRDPTGLDFLRPLVLANSRKWEFAGDVHEKLIDQEGVSFEVIAGLINFTNTKIGGRSQDPDKWMHDVAVLKEAIAKDPNNPRNWFYLAQSYGNAQKYP